MTPRIWFSKFIQCESSQVTHLPTAIDAVTGASSGFGRTMTEIVLKNGDIAVATLRTPAALDPLVALYPATQLLVLQLDVNDHDAVVHAFARAQEAFGRIDVVFNNAGRGLVGDMEITPHEAARALFDVNFWSAAAVTREAIRVFREVNQPRGGRLLQMSSVTGIAGTPCASFYSASKHCE